MIIAGTGTRQIAKNYHNLEDYTQKMAELLSLGRNKNYDLSVISGCAEGFDEALAKAANIAGIPWTAALPWAGYGQYYWQNRSVTGADRFHEFQELLDTASDVVITPNGYGNESNSNLARNKWMVDNCDKLWTPDWVNGDSGTQHTLNYAASVERPFYVVRI